jgi:hypothetical protein
VHGTQSVNTALVITSDNSCGLEEPDVDVPVKNCNKTGHENLQEVQSVNKSAVSTGRGASSTQLFKPRITRKDKKSCHVHCSSFSLDDDQLPPLAFHCHLCNDVLDCDHDSKNLIYSHYAQHGITNITAMHETLPSGETVIKLMELPQMVQQFHTAEALKNSVNHDNHPKWSGGILVGGKHRLNVNAVNSGKSPISCTRQHRHVTWADEVSRTQNHENIESVTGSNCTESQLSTSCQHTAPAGRTFKSLSFYNMPPVARHPPLLCRKIKRKRLFASHDTQEFGSQSDSTHYSSEQVVVAQQRQSVMSQQVSVKSAKEFYPTTVTPPADAAENCMRLSHSVYDENAQHSTQIMPTMLRCHGDDVTTTHNNLVSSSNDELVSCCQKSTGFAREPMTSIVAPCHTFCSMPNDDCLIFAGTNLSRSSYVAAFGLSLPTVSTSSATDISQSDVICLD